VIFLGCVCFHGVSFKATFRPFDQSYSSLTFTGFASESESDTTTRAETPSQPSGHIQKKVFASWSVRQNLQKFDSFEGVSLACVSSCQQAIYMCELLERVYSDIHMSSSSSHCPAHWNDCRSSRLSHNVQARSSYAVRRLRGWCLKAASSI
jgi:hypothetical protein